MEEKHEIVDSVEMLEKTIKQVKKAQQTNQEYHLLKWQFKKLEWE